VAVRAKVVQQRVVGACRAGAPALLTDGASRAAAIAASRDCDSFLSAWVHQDGRALDTESKRYIVNNLPAALKPLARYIMAVCGGAAKSEVGVPRR
jgi:hypothetical protein